MYKINFVTNLPTCGHNVYTLFAVKGKQKITTMLHIHKRQKACECIHFHSEWLTHLPNLWSTMNNPQMINKKNYNRNYNMRHTYSEIQLDILPHVRILSFQNFPVWIHTGSTKSVWVTLQWKIMRAKTKNSVPAHTHLPSSTITHLNSICQQLVKL